MPRYAASRTLLASVDEVWAFLAEPHHLADWWPGIAGVEPDRRGLAVGARWQTRAGNVTPAAGLSGFFGPGLVRRPGATGTLLVTTVEPGRRLAFRLVGERTDVEIDLEDAGSRRTRVGLAVEVRWGAARRSLPQHALARLHDLVQTSAGA